MFQVHRDIVGRATELRESQKLCYGCLEPGYSAKDYHHSHFYDTFKGKHPTALHDDNYRKERSPLEGETN